MWLKSNIITTVHQPVFTVRGILRGKQASCCTTSVFTSDSTPCCYFSSHNASHFFLKCLLSWCQPLSQHVFVCIRVMSLCELRRRTNRCNRCWEETVSVSYPQEKQPHAASYESKETMTDMWNSTTARSATYSQVELGYYLWHARLKIFSSYAAGNESYIRMIMIWSTWQEQHSTV